MAKFVVVSSSELLLKFVAVLTVYGCLTFPVCVVPISNLRRRWFRPSCGSTWAKLVCSLTALLASARFLDPLTSLSFVV